jgi:hypothetical protein
MRTYQCNIKYGWSVELICSVPVAGRTPLEKARCLFRLALPIATASSQLTRSAAPPTHPQPTAAAAIWPRFLSAFGCRAQEALQCRGEDLVDDSQRLAAMPKHVLPAEERPLGAKAAAVQRRGAHVRERSRACECRFGREVCGVDGA